MTADDVNLYVNWALYAVLGKLAEADELLRTYGAAIRRVAGELRRRFPFKPRSLHRGIMMDDADCFDPSGRAFTSWSESEDVAEWFADPRSVMNEHMVAAHPQARGFLLSLDEPPDVVLFHHLWASDIGDLPMFALHHPHMGSMGAHQIGWALFTQQEVITESPTTWPELRAFSPHRPPLDYRYAPPWMMMRTQ